MLYTTRKGGTLEYKCRNCNKIDDSTHVPDIYRVLICLAHNIKLEPELNLANIGMTNIHLCDNGEIGITDLIGGRIDYE